MKLALIAAAAMAVAGCHQSPPNPPSPPDASDASFDSLAPADACDAASSNLLKLQCKDARGRLLGGPNEHDAGFADVCRDDLSKGVDVHASCLASATTCQQALACGL